MGKAQEYARHGESSIQSRSKVTWHGPSLVIFHCEETFFYHSVLSFSLTRHRKLIKTYNRLSSLSYVAPLSKDKRPSPLLALLPSQQYHSLYLSYETIWNISFWMLFSRITVILIFLGAVIWEGYVVAQLVEALRYKPEGRGFDSRWDHWEFTLT